MAEQRDFDIVEMPLEGVAAYWLSLRKLLGAKRTLKPLEEEVSHTREPFIRYLLDLATSGVENDRLERLAAIRAETRLQVLRRTFDLKRMALMDIASGENPRKTLAKMTAQFARSPVDEGRAFQLAQELMATAAKPEEHPAYYSVHHARKVERVIVVLLFYVLWARHEGKLACQTFLAHCKSPFFCDGLALVVDGFDAPFIRKRLRVHRDAMLEEAARKMQLSTLMCIDLKSRQPYDAMFQAAQAYLD